MHEKRNHAIKINATGEDAVARQAGQRSASKTTLREVAGKPPGKTVRESVKKD
jgi:hypothetical protein